MKSFCLSKLFIVSLWLLAFKASYGVGYVPTARARLNADAITIALRNNMLRAANSTDVGLILGAEIASNNTRFQLPSQKGLLSAHLVTHGHYVDWYATYNRRMGAVRLPWFSRYDVIAPDDNKTFVLCQQITSNILDLLLSGRVSFSVGALQCNGGALQPGDLPNGFVLYANLAGHGIPNLNDHSGQHFSAGVVPVVTNTNYLKIAVQVKEPLPDPTGVNIFQVVIITMFHENPASDVLRNSILPNGVDAMGNPRGVAVGGALPPPPAPDNRIPPVAPLAPAALVAPAP